MDYHENPLCEPVRLPTGSLSSPFDTLRANGDIILYLFDFPFVVRPACRSLGAGRYRTMSGILAGGFGKWA